MRLICPNCGAHYAIDPRIIPEAGRDVQCSACSHTWFQTREEDAEASISPPHPIPEPAPAPAETTADERSSAASGSPTSRGDVDEVPPPVEPTKREIDPEVMSVLREEAARERAARQAERAALEVQGDLDLPEPSIPAPTAEVAAPGDTVDVPGIDVPERTGHPAIPDQADPATADAPALPAAAAPAAAVPAAVVPRRPSAAGTENRPEAPVSDSSPAADDSDQDAPTDAAPEPELRPAPRPSAQGGRGTLLPDIEEINSTLEPAHYSGGDGQIERPEAPSARIARARRGQGRRIGFAMACLIFGLCAVLYNKGPEIGEAVPAFAPGLEAYVTKVQEGRVWLDGLFRKAGQVQVGSEG